MPTLYEIAASVKSNQQTVVDAITCEAPISPAAPPAEYWPESGDRKSRPSGSTVGWGR